MRVFWFLSFATVLGCVVAPARAGTSNSLLDVSPDGTRLLVTNSDNGTVTVVDTNTREPLREIEVGEKPEGVTWIGNGPLAAVTVYREDRVVFFDADMGKIIKRLAVPNEPYGIVADPAGTTAWVLELLERQPQLPTSGGQRPSESQGQIILDDVHFAYAGRPDVSALAGGTDDIAPRLQCAFM